MMIMGTNKFETSKNVKDRSKKDCTCGGHNASNVSRNLNHNSTKARLLIRLSRKLIPKLRSE